MKLYYASGTCALAPHIILYELQCDFEVERVDLKNKVTAAGEDFLSVNPKGYVPALLTDDGYVLTEVPVVLHYLADLAPDKHLIPERGSWARYQILEWLNFLATEIHHATLPWIMKEVDKIPSKVAHRIDFISQKLVGKPYLLNSFTIADAYCFTLLQWAIQHQWPIDVQLQEYCQRIAERPAVQAAIAAELLP